MELPVMYKDKSIPERRLIREEYIRRQGGSCWFCKHQLNQPPPNDITDKRINKRLFPVNFFKWPVHLHHDHVSGLSIGAVHAYCNAVLWQYYGE